MTNNTDPPAPQPEQGHDGKDGDKGTEDSGGKGGQGGDGGRGGIGLTGATGDAGKTGQTGRKGDQGNRGNQGNQGEQGEQGKQGRTGDIQTRFNKIAVFLAVFLTALAAAYFSVVAQNRLDDASAARQRLDVAQTAYEHKVDCQQELVDQTIGAQKARSAFTETQAQVNLLRLEAQQTYIRVVSAQPPPLPPDARRALLTYLSALNANITATREQLAVTDHHSYPTAVQIAMCD